MTTISSYQQIVQNLPRSLARISKRPDVALESTYFMKNIGKVKSADDLLGDDRLYRFAMNAFGLKDMIFGKAFMRKVLNEGVDSSSAFAMQLSDPRFRDFASAFNFKRLGASTMSTTASQTAIVDRYVRQQLEADAGSTDEGVRLALYFQRKAPSVSGIYGLMGDAALYKVVQTALNLPASYSNVDITRQASYIGSKLNMADLQDPEKLDRFVQRFAANWQMTHADKAQAAPTIALLQSPFSGFSATTLMSLQTLKR